MTDPSSKTKKVYLNGVIVGEIQATGDHETDLRRMQEYLRSKGLYRETTDVEACFRHALSFATTAAYLHERDLLNAPRGPLSIVPFVVNCAFSIELYLKTLYLIAGKTARGHRLLKLFDGLPPEVKSDVVSAAILNAKAYGVAIGGAEDFRNLVAELNDAYVSWRYGHETGNAGVVAIWPMILVTKALDATCRVRGGFRTKQMQ